MHGAMGKSVSPFTSEPGSWARSRHVWPRHVEVRPQGTPPGPWLDYARCRMLCEGFIRFPSGSPVRTNG